MRDFDEVDAIDWHDGVLLESKSTFKQSQSNMTLIVDVYNGKDKREKVIIEFIKIENFVFTIDSIELSDNFTAGNISGGYIKKTANNDYCFFLYLSDGYLSLTFKCLRLIHG